MRFLDLFFDIGTFWGSNKGKLVNNIIDSSLKGLSFCPQTQVF